MSKPLAPRHSGEQVPTLARPGREDRALSAQPGNKRAGSALGSLLGGRASAARDETGRSLLLGLLELHALGALSFERGAAVYGDCDVAEPSTAGATLGPVGPARGSGLPGGGRVALGVGVTVVGGADLETAHPYNMGSLSASGCDAE